MARRRSRPQRSGLAGLWLFLLGVLAGGGILYLACHDSLAPRSESGKGESAVPHAKPKDRAEQRLHPGTSEGHRQPAAGLTAPAGETPAPVPGGPAEASPTPARPARVALVIDDLGRSVDDLVPLESLGVPITYSVLPFQENTAAVAAQLRSRREEILLHLPMQAKNGENPGPGALRLGMTDDQLRAGTVAALQAVPGAVGVNNHMGSGLSVDARAMSAVLRVLSSRGLFFLDSRTSPQSVGYRTAMALGVPAAERQVFLDSDPGPAAVHEQFQRLLELARTRGAAVAIGHPHPDTLSVLTDEVPRARSRGYDFVPVSFLLDRAGGPE